ncbi:carboxymuconolactone decarboxylase family protein [Cronobacter malonaticus]|uniref:carboxymuconolactone decarboxylase family protein n=1 Tax=Cronobacter malonaticus TaxID=413503 RepID=UPI00029BE350|nr:carboxymuconolactone decarboxylase family protein [Cronobacter malonaticus]ELY2669120.1 carboxymuconolactone decarboxylase family protein [Cronobacter sakazakii]CCJ98507.1 4-carboxymuconolactone decarboxylase domain/alkylhydroperoxidase AhpD family core domain protein [Cronobacter malonaticus 507]ELQ6261600.1 carboxymuconolactone decarboxylase family protein [Cronobacter malonaticus]ELY2759092.1 carboxymuconolactone decarboxylase family protein [Cronobacter sakazakii]ELY2765746.1 carboxymuc
MSTRVNHYQTIPALVNTLMNASAALKKSSLTPTLKQLIDMRASQLNGCAFCVDMHAKEAKMAGERELRLYHLPVWRESPLFSAKEKAALTLTEAITHIREEGISDAVYQQAREHFSETEIAEIAFAVAIINSWNRLQLVSQMAPGSQDAAFGLARAGLE